ncbi:hypothetical protein LXL04_012938 [Taraxacum kok-saghyz]
MARVLCEHVRSSYRFHLLPSISFWHLCINQVFKKMAKSKQKQHPTDPDFEEFVQDGWVIVKKQKVTILIPPLPITQQFPTPNPCPTPLQPLPISTQEVDDDHITPPQPDPPLPLVTTKPITTCSNPRKLNHRGRLVNSRTINYNPKPRKWCGNLVNGHMLVNTKMRALNLERKLKRAGGLNSWLVSLGLGQFVKIFRCRRVGKMQLVNLTMKKLKDMEESSFMYCPFGRHKDVKMTS